MQKKSEKWEVLIKTSLLEDEMDPLLNENSKDDDEHEARERRDWLKIKDGVSSYEISAIRKSNKHGHESWGWGDADAKIVLFKDGGNDLEADKDEVVSEETLKWAEKVTQGLCDLLNKMEK